MFGFGKKQEMPEIEIPDGTVAVTISVNYDGGSFIFTRRLREIPSVGNEIYVHTKEAKRANSSGRAIVNDVTPCFLEGSTHYMVNAKMVKYDKHGTYGKHKPYGLLGRK